MDDDDWYDLLTESQTAIVQLLSTHVPESNYGAPVKLTTADSGLTYDFPQWPWGSYELREGPDGRLLLPQNEFEPFATDRYVPEGNRIRWAGQKKRTFPDGPYARFVAETGVIDVSTEPTIRPPSAGLAVVYRSAGAWAERGEERDPRPYRRQLKLFLWGDPEEAADFGMIGALKLQYGYKGALAMGDTSEWWRSIDTGAGYQRFQNP